MRTVDKVRPPYPLGDFPKGAIVAIAGGIVFHYYANRKPDLEGKDWECMFADAVGADWKPSNVGLDDIQLKGCCWAAKTVKNNTPARTKHVRLISGRNSLVYSYGIEDPPQSMPTERVGELVLGIWNERVGGVRARFGHSRTVVLIKSPDLRECAVFEFETLRFDSSLFSWKWNKRGNLEGHNHEGTHKFTWQPHGAQFTVVEVVPANRVAFRLRMPEFLDKKAVLETMGFDESWVEILK